MEKILTPEYDAIPKHTHELERWSTDKTGNRCKEIHDAIILREKI